MAPRTPRTLYQQEGESAHECFKGEQLDRIEAKLDSFLERITAVEGRVFAHEMVAAAVVALSGMGLGIWGLVK